MVVVQASHSERCEAILCAVLFLTTPADAFPLSNGHTLLPQSLVSRETSPLDSGVVSITLLKGGDGAYNVIPNDVQLGGTIRCC